MNIRKTIAAVCSCALLLGTMTACAKQTTNDDTTIQEESTLKTYIPNTDNVKPLGRTKLVDDTLWMAFSGSGAEFTFNGTKASVTIAGDVNAANANNEDNQARIAIYVNGCLEIGRAHV